METLNKTQLIEFVDQIVNKEQIFNSDVCSYSKEKQVEFLNSESVLSYGVAVENKLVSFLQVFVTSEKSFGDFCFKNIPEEDLIKEPIVKGQPFCIYFSSFDISY